MRKYPRGHKWWSPSSEEAAILEAIKEYESAISLTKGFVGSCYHSSYVDSRKAIAKYEQELTKLKQKLQEFIDAESQK